MPEIRLTADHLKEFRRPFEPAAVKFKGQSAKAAGSEALVVPYIDNRLVIERLNHVVGGDWHNEYDSTQGGMWCHLTVCGVTRTDYGTVAKGAQEAVRNKGLVSDSMKRSAVLFGIGVSIYASPSIWLPKGPMVGITMQDGRVKGIYINEPGLKKAREEYSAWLEETGKAAFGEPLGHGDVEEAAGLDDEGNIEGAEAAEPQAPPALLVDVEADKLRAVCRSTYEEIRQLKGGRTKLPPARFQERLVEASTSHDSLKEYARELHDLVDELKGEG